MGLVFEWSTDKAAANLTKHGVSFAEASEVFSDPLSIDYDDPDHSNAEDRAVIIGASLRHRLLFVSFTEREGRIRIISARTLTPQERGRYENESR